MCYVWVEPAITGATSQVLSIIIPTLNAEKDLPATLDSIAGSGLVSEVIVSDGGSIDSTPVIAAEAVVVFVVDGGGRGPQLITGARAAVGDWLMFLHADSRLQPGWDHAVKAFMADRTNCFHAGYFAFALNDSAPAARRLEALVRLRCRIFGLPYGDQGLLISREFYDFLGGYASIPLMEDVEIARRIGRRRLSLLPGAAVTSADRYRQSGYWLRPARNLICVGLYFLGFPPRLIGPLYE